MDDIIRHIRDRFWRLPDAIVERQRAQRRAYQRRYMRDAYRPRRKALSIVLTPAEHARLSRAAATAGYTPTAFFRQAAFAYLDQGYAPPADLVAAVGTLEVALRALGNNLNQLARQAHQDGAGRRLLQEGMAILAAIRDTAAQHLRRPPDAH